jgi:hypothetical protein
VAPFAQALASEKLNPLEVRKEIDPSHGLQQQTG